MNDAQRRKIRTTVQTAVSACAVLLVVTPMAMSQLEAALPPRYFAYAASAAAIVVAVARFVTSIMNSPAVERFLQERFPWLAAGEAPDAGVADDGPVDEIVNLDPK